MEAVIAAAVNPVTTFSFIEALTSNFPMVVFDPTTAALEGLTGSGLKKAAELGNLFWVAEVSGVAAKIAEVEAMVLSSMCRFQLPTENDESKDRRRSRFAAVRFREFMMEDEDLFGFESTLRHIARRHRVVFPHWRESIMEESLLSPTQVGEAEPGVERSNSVETVSSWPSWPVEGGINVGGDDGDIGVSARMNEDGDIIMS